MFSYLLFFFLFLISLSSAEETLAVPALPTEEVEEDKVKRRSKAACAGNKLELDGTKKPSIRFKGCFKRKLAINWGVLIRETNCDKNKKIEQLNMNTLTGDWKEVTDAKIKENRKMYKYEATAKVGGKDVTITITASMIVKEFEDTGKVKHMPGSVKWVWKVANWPFAAEGNCLRFCVNYKVAKDKFTAEEKKKFKHGDPEKASQKAEVIEGKLVKTKNRPKFVMQSFGDFDVDSPTNTICGGEVVKDSVIVSNKENTNPGDADETKKAGKKVVRHRTCLSIKKCKGSNDVTYDPDITDEIPDIENAAPRASIFAALSLCLFALLF